MTAIHVDVTADRVLLIRVAAPEAIADVGRDRASGDVVELAIAERTGQDAMCDEDGPGQEIATIGAGGTTLVVQLPPTVAPWVDRYYRGEPVEPFGFDVAIEDWLVALVRPAVRCADCGADLSAIPTSGPGHTCSTPWTAGRAGAPSIDTETRHLREQEVGG